MMEMQNTITSSAMVTDRTVVNINSGMFQMPAVVLILDHNTAHTYKTCTHTHTESQTYIHTHTHATTTMQTGIHVKTNPASPHINNTYMPHRKQ